MLSLFYGSAALIYFVSLHPETLTEWLIRNGRPPEVEITPFNIIPFLVAEIKGRFLLVYPYIVGGILASAIAVIALVSWHKAMHALGWKESKGSFRGIGITLSKLPILEEPAKARMSFSLPSGISKKHKPLLLDLLNYLGKHPKSFVGDGHKGTLLEHTLNVIEKALNHPDPDPLLVLAAAAHDIGKTTSHKKVGNEWQRQGFHDKEGARILASFGSWWAMDETERTILFYAVRYEHSKSSLPYQIPGLVTDEVARTRALLDQLHSIDGMATKEEKAEVLKEIDVGEAVMSAFLRALPQMPFQVRGMKRGISACGWRQGDRLYMIEHRVRDLSMAMMDKDQSAALGGKYREKGQVSAYSQALFDALDERGWLIKKHETQRTPDAEIVEMKVPADFPLWKVAAGTANFNGIFVVELPEDQRHFYPAQSQYTIVVTSPLADGNRVIEIKDKGNSEGKSSSKKPVTVEIKPISTEKPTETVEIKENAAERVETMETTQTKEAEPEKETSKVAERKLKEQKPKVVIEIKPVDGTEKIRPNPTTPKPDDAPPKKAALDDIGDVEFFDDADLF